MTSWTFPSFFTVSVMVSPSGATLVSRSCRDGFRTWEAMVWRNSEYNVPPIARVITTSITVARNGLIAERLFIVLGFSRII